MPGQFRLGKENLKTKIARLRDLGIHQEALFPAVREELKDKTGTYSYAKENFYLESIRAVKMSTQKCS